MAKDKRDTKGSNKKRNKDTKKKTKKPTSEDLPGDGALKKAGEAAEEHQKEVKRILKEAGL